MSTDQSEARPLFARPPNPDLDHTTITVRISKTAAQMVDAAIIHETAYGRRSNRQAKVAEIIEEWMQRELHRHTVTNNVLRGNLQVVDSGAAENEDLLRREQAMFGGAR